ncbi:MAG: hypothetical protein B0D92_07895 [Spirochaeta sp. LUC14_002_19_P3]|nr:MAG: hypothetical protein B0D92_07895 [Spirochaeta sp. LUC14_002_19_P3]
MDRNGAFIEYARILKDAEDWLTAGERREEEDITLTLPASPAQSSRKEQTESPPRLAAPKVIKQPKNPVFAPPQLAASGGSAEELKKIAAEIQACEGCSLNLVRQNTVPGWGRAGAGIMIVTPPPPDGIAEDAQPLPGFEKDYLDKWLAAIGLNFDQDVFITPAVKCRTPGRRPPHPEEAAACAGYLRRQYTACAPRGVLGLGDAACGALSGNPRDFPALVGKDWHWGEIPALILWTPAEVLANPNRLRRPVWEALQRFGKALQGSLH